MADVLRKMGSMAINGIWQLGFIARFFWLILVYSGQSFTRIHLTLRELYFSGVMSLLIILVSGLFVGLVLGLQGYETLQRYGASDSLGTLVALSLVRELGPVVAGLLFASRAGSAVTAEGIGLMKVTEQLKAIGHDGGEPHRPGGGAKARQEPLVDGRPYVTSTEAFRQSEPSGHGGTRPGRAQNSSH